MQTITLGHRHTPLRLEWSEGQLRPLVEVLRERIGPRRFSYNQWMAMASVARSVVTEYLSTVGALHYSRSRTAYSAVKPRYRSVDARHTFYFVTGAVDALRGAGLVGHNLGTWFGGEVHGIESTVWPKPELIELISPLITATEPRALAGDNEVLVLRRREDKVEIDYIDTDDTRRMRQEIQTLNQGLQELTLVMGGTPVMLPPLRRIFNGNWERGGRLYFHGDSYQNCPKNKRRKIEFVIDGEVHRSVEYDLSSLHIRLAHAEAGKKVREEDPYEIPGFDRSLIKLGVNILFNAETTQSAIGALTTTMWENNHYADTRVACHELAKKVIAAIQRKHYRIAEFFGSDCGARYQVLDSRIAIKVMVRVKELTGSTPLPVHDSFIVPAHQETLLRKVVGEAYEEEVGDLGHHSAPPTPRSPFRRGETSSDQGIDIGLESSHVVRTGPYNSRSFQQSHPPPPNNDETLPTWEPTTPAPTDAGPHHETDWVSDWATNSFSRALAARASGERRRAEVASSRRALSGVVIQPTTPTLRGHRTQPVDPRPGRLHYPCSASRFAEIHRQLRHTFTVRDRTGEAW